MFTVAEPTRYADGWDRLADLARYVPTRSIAALWRALNYLCVAQLYLADNVRLDAPLATADVKAVPRGHWGVCPPVNLALAAVAPLQRAAGPARVRIIHGAGHAAPSALAMGYLTGSLGQRWPAFRRSRTGLQHLVTGFPHANELGSEITPMLPGHAYMGGQLGPALAFATGHVLDAPDRLAVVLVGDGECETGTASAAWLAERTFAGSGRHGCVLPIVLLNGLRMGGPSLLAGLDRQEQVGYFTGLGYAPIVVHPPDVAGMRVACDRATRDLRPVGSPGRPPVLLLTLAKGSTGPVEVAGRRILGTPMVHKTPLDDPRRDAEEFAALRRWLASYRPHELIDPDGQPTDLVAAALPYPDTGPASHTVAGPPRRSAPATPLGQNASALLARPDAPIPRQPFGRAVAAVVTRHAAAGGFRLFSPDELVSNRISLDTQSTDCPPWVREILNEELCHLWLHGYLEGGGAGLFVSYEAFATVTTSLLHQYLKQRAVARYAGNRPAASMNYLLTSLGWTNTYTHQNPGLVSSLIETEDPTVRVYTPADPARVAVVLDAMLRSVDRLNLMVADKHTRDQHPTDTIDEELRHGAAVWRHLSDADRPALVLAAAGDVATRHLSAAPELLRAARPGAPLRFVQIGEITSLGDPTVRPHALSPDMFTGLFTDHAPVLLLVPGYPGAVRSLLWSRPGAARRFTVLGYREPGRPMSPEALLRFCGFDAQSLCRAAVRLLDAARHVPDQPAESLDERAQESSDGS